MSTICFNCHNEYVWQLSGCNQTNEVLYETIIPELLTVCVNLSFTLANAKYLHSAVLTALTGAFFFHLGCTGDIR